MSQPLDYASSKQVRRRGVACYVLLGVNCLTLLVGLFLLFMVYTAARGRNGWGQLGAMVIGVPTLAVQFVVFVPSAIISGGWRDPLAWLSGFSLSSTGLAMAILIFGPHYGGC